MATIKGAYAAEGVLNLPLGSVPNNFKSFESSLPEIGKVLDVVEERNCKTISNHEGLIVMDKDHLIRMEDLNRVGYIPDPGVIGLDVNESEVVVQGSDKVDRELNDDKTEKYGLELTRRAALERSQSPERGGSEWRAGSDEGALVVNKRSKLTLDGVEISLIVIETTNLIGHYNAADFCMLSDFEDIKMEMDTVNKSFVTVGRPWVYILGSKKIRINVRDTYLLTAPGQSSLGAVGKFYGSDFEKVELSVEEISNMDRLAVCDWEKFKGYALIDSVIPIIHASCMESFMFERGSIGVPLTTSSLSANLLNHFWREKGYKGYQINEEYLLGDMGKLMTPKGLNAIGSVGVRLPYFIKATHGGRNESFMYGIDEKRKYYDYDLEAAYTTAMSMQGNPDYAKARDLKHFELESMSDFELIHSYTVIECDFKFPDDVIYPSIPVRADKITTVYPLKGYGVVITGIEYVLAKRRQ